MTVLVTVIAALVIGFIIGRNRRHLYHFQNRGEALVSHALQARFVAPNYHLLNHVTLRQKGDSTQIDHVLVSRFGVFVIETKDYGGWIFGGPDDRYWTQVHFRAKHRFQNPIHQNFKHVCAIRDLLEFLPDNAVRSVVVFTGDAEFKTDVPDGVFTLASVVAYIEEHRTEVMSANRLQFCVGRLETSRLSITKATDVEHIQRLRRRYDSNEQE